jgi:uncharacterized protein
MRLLRAYPLAKDAIFIGALLLAWWWVRSAISEPEVDYARYDHGLYAQGRLFLLQKQGYGDIYVFGTFHSSDPWVLELPKAVEDALLDVQLFATEAAVDWSDSTAAAEASRQAVERLNQLCVLPANQSVRSLLGERLFAELVSRLSDPEIWPVLGFSTAPPPELLDRVTPWCMTQYLDRPLRELRWESDGALILDYALLRDARDRDIPILHLESLDEQLELRASMPLTLQIEELAIVLEPSDSVAIEVTWHEFMLDYLSGNNDIRSWMEDFSEAYQNFVLRTILVARNRLMVERLLDQVDERTVFVATGAGHLPGEEGIVNLLAREGYSVTVLEPPL